LCGGVNELINCYQPRTFIVNDKKGDWFAAFHNILVRWRKRFSQLLYIHRVNDVRKTGIHTAEPLVPEPSAFEVELAIIKLKVTKHQALIKSQQD
jgi:hypothetical protein